MRPVILAAALLCVTPAFAQDSPQKPEKLPDTMLVSREAIVGLMSEIEAFTSLDKRAAVLLSPGYQAVIACIADNPVDGVTKRTGPDQCPAVTAALAEQAKAHAAAKAAKPDTPAAP